MAFCCNCGKELIDGAKFCFECGSPISNSDSQRKTVYDGEIHKCPNCGEVLESFTPICPACGLELRDIAPIGSVKELELKLWAIEAKRENRKTNRLKDRLYGQELSEIDNQKISLIRSFSVPNTKEDIWEFLILAKSNIDVSLFDVVNHGKHDARIEVSKAWKAKFEQTYNKAKLTFGDDPAFVNIQKIYDKMNKEIRKAKWFTFRMLGYAWILPIVAVAIILIDTKISGPKAEAAEIARLSAIVTDIENALENGEYKLALMNAETLEYGRYDSEQKRQWDIKRQYWIETIIEEATVNGIELEYIPEK